MAERLQHLVFVRHGESEGDVRRAAWKRGEHYASNKDPNEEEVTELGVRQSELAGRWIKEQIIGQFAITNFDSQFVSLSLRSLQTAIAMNLGNQLWQGDERLNERNRGQIRGMKAEQHRQLYPSSFKQMKDSPLRWTPPGGESILSVAERWQSFYNDIKDINNVIIIGHRDQMWAAMQPLEGLSDEQMTAVNTDEIHNSQIVHYTSINPNNNKQEANLRWKRSVDPQDLTSDTGWQIINPNPSSNNLIDAK